MVKKIPRSISCHECGDVKLKYKTASGKRRRYFCSETHALKFAARKITRESGVGVKYTPQKLKSNKYFRKKDWYEKI